MLMCIRAFGAFQGVGSRGVPRCDRSLVIRCRLLSASVNACTTGCYTDALCLCVNSDGPPSAPSSSLYRTGALRRRNQLFLNVANRTLSTANHTTSQADASEENSYKFPKLSKKVLKKVRSIERLYRPPLNEYKDTTSPLEYTDHLVHVPKIPLHAADTALDGSGAPGSSPQEYERTKSLVKCIYKSATGGVFNGALWSRYIHKLSIVAGVLQPADICLVMYSFAKVRYRDNHLLKIMAPLIVRNLSSMSCGGVALILNALKRLELRNYDIIDLATNEICLKMDHANLQDISLTANTLSFFHIYHQRFWNMLTKAVSLRHHQMNALQAALLLAAVAKLDIRNPLLLRLLKDKLRPAVEKGELSQELLTLSFHSFAKLDFVAKNFYDACVERFARILAEKPDTIDSQSLVLYLYTAVCILNIPQETVEASLKLLCTRKDLLKNYKALKLKYVFDHLKFKQPEFADKFDSDLKALQHKVKEYQIQKINRKLSRWAMEVSRLLQSHGVEHRRNVLFDYVYADIYIKEYSVAIRCAGPYSYYAMSHKPTVFSQVEMKTLSMKGIKVCPLPYHEWNALRTTDEKLKYLKKFGEAWAAVHFQQHAE